MQSRRDQVQAHMFVMGRLTSGVLRLEPDGLDQPVTRTSRGTMGGLAVAVVLAVVVGLYGLIQPGGNSAWRKPGTLVLEKDSGARFLSLDGTLHPVLNVASARLLTAGQMTVASVKAKSLAGAPRGRAVGLIGAPDDVPAAADLVTGPWLACAGSVADATGTLTAKVTLAIGISPPATGLSLGEALAVSGPDDHAYLLWNGQRLRMDRRAGVLQALGKAGAQLRPVTAAFLDAIPAGPDFGVPMPDSAGRAGPVLAAQPTRVGQLFTDSAQDYYLLGADGLEALTPALFALFRADPRTQAQAYGGTPITVRSLGPADLAGHLAPASATAALTHDGALPAAVPTVLNLVAQQNICAWLTPGPQSSMALAVVRAGAIAAAQPPERQPGLTASCRPAQAIAVRPGKGVLVNASLAGGGPGLADFLVSDAGIKYPIPSREAVAALGYGEATPTVVPNAWISLLPTGPSLDPSAVLTATVMPRGAPPCPSGLS